MIMNRTQELLLQRVSQALFGVPDTSSISEDVLREARAQAVTALVTNDYQMIANNIRVIAAHAELTQLLESIPFTTIKGYASAFYYPAPEKRIMGDVDFIVPPEYYQTTVAQLLQAEWSRLKENKVPERDEPYQKGNTIYELHSEIKGIPNGVGGIKTEFLSAEVKVRELLANLIDTSVKVETQYGPIIIPDEFHHGLIMLLHVAGHMMTGEGVGLRHLCDWAVYAHRTDLEQYRDIYENIGLWTFACQLTSVSSAYLGLPKKQWAGEWPEQFLESLINDFLNAGNFGRKTVGRGSSIILERDSFSDLIKKRIPICQDHPALLPLATAFYLCRYVVRVISGKKKSVKLSTIKEAKKRKILYDQFQLFSSGKR